MTTANGYDSPVLSHEEDRFGRWSFANRVYRVVGRAPAEWSLRAAIYGKWGEGKTSALNFLQSMAETDGHIVLTISPWDADSTDVLWIKLVDALITRMEKAGVKVDKKTLAKAKISKWLIWLPNAKGVAEADPLAKAAFGGLDILRGLLQPDGDFLKAVRNKISGRRIIVIIDDLDRADPKVIPRLLLGLREILDIPGFSFVMAFDLDIVAEALTEYHRGYGAGHPFLEKIVDFPFYLPAATSRDLALLREMEANKYCAFVPKEAWIDIEDLLPNNPRKLKLLVRNIACLEDEVSRHDSDELDWVTILIAHLIRLESELFLRGFVDTIIESNEIDWIGFMGDENDQEEKRTNAVNTLLDQLGIIDEARRKRLSFLVDKWYARKLRVGDLDVRYQVFLNERPHAITWKEFRQFFELWRTDPTSAVVSTWLKGQASNRRVSIDAVARELFLTTIDFRSRKLHSAADSISLEEQSHAAAEAVLLLNLLNQLWELTEQSDGVGFLPAEEMLGRLFEQSAYWIHFKTNDADKSAREEERKTLMAWVVSMKGEPEALAETIKPWGDTGVHGPERKALAVELFKPLERPLAQLGIQLFEQPAGIQKFREQGKHEALNYLLLDGGSAFWSADNRASLWGILAKSSTSSSVFQNVIEFIEAIIASSKYGSSVVHRDETILLVQDEDVMRKLWQAAIARRSQFRFHSELRKLRHELCALGANSEHLEMPEWLEAAPVDTAPAPTNEDNA